MDIVKVRDAEHWGQVLESSEKKLIGTHYYLQLSAVVDVHKDWCGPCKIIEPTYKRLAVDIEAAERRITFATLSVGLEIEGIEDTGSCKPYFLLFKDRKQIADVVGANAPQLEQLVKQHCPPLGNDDDEV